MRAKFINEITSAENAWADSQIDNWKESQKFSEEDLEEYTNKITNAIWQRLRRKLSLEYLKTTGTNKLTLKDYISEYDSPYGLYMSVADYWQENIPWDEAANTMFDEVYRAITAQHGAM